MRVRALVSLASAPVATHHCAALALQLLSHHQGLDRIATGGPPPRDAAVPGARTVAELCADAAAIGARLADLPRGGEVAVACHDRYLFAAALLGAWERGLVVALPPNTQPETLRLLRVGGSVLTVLHDQAGAPGIDVRTLVGGAVPPGELRRPSALPAERRVVVVYTSGTTGTPMACPKTAGQLIGEAIGLSRTFGVRAGDSIVATVPPHHIYGLLFGVLLPLVCGGSFARETPLHAEEVHAVLTRDAARVLVSVPAHLRALRIMRPAGLERVARVFSSGAPLPAETWAAVLERFGWRPIEVLGSSETGGIGWRDAPDAPFVVFDGITVREGDGGRMVLESPYLPPGGDRPWVASDRVAVIDARHFRHLGRADGVLKVGSTRVSIPELEARLLAVPGVEDAAVIGVEVGGARGHESWAVVAGHGLTVHGIRENLLRWLDAVVVPRRFRIVAALPREATGKLKREALRALFDEPAPTGHEGGEGA